MKAAPSLSAAGGPLLIALHGGTESERSSLAARLAQEAAPAGRIAGWLSVDGESIRLDEDRDDTVPTVLLVLDGLANAGDTSRTGLEAARALMARQPAAVMVTLATEQLAATADGLGQAFDIEVDASDPRAMQRLREVLVTRRDYERIGWFGALAGGIEVSAGSVVHGARIPFGGLGMATTQATVLTRAAGPLVDRGRVVWVALLSAAIKSLSPAGQRLRPMVAIAMQGWLYARALKWLGWNRGAVAVGGFLMGAWAGSQGLVMQWLLVGDALAVALNALSAEVAGWFGARAPGLAVLVTCWLCAHGAVVATGTLLSWKRGPPAPSSEQLPRWFSGISMPQRRSWAATLAQALRDLLRPAFWLPLLLIIAALAWAGQPGETLVWVALRALLIGWILFVVVQRLDLPALPERLRRLGMWGPAIAWRRALARLQAGQAP
jgi:hypothetical protein